MSIVNDLTLNVPNLLSRIHRISLEDREKTTRLPVLYGNEYLEHVQLVTAKRRVARLSDRVVEDVLPGDSSVNICPQSEKSSA